jgi:nicotinate-nucleotide adenylyltransferase
MASSLCRKKELHMASDRPTQRFGVLGGTFDPVHIGHLIIAQEAVSLLDLDRFFFLPAGEPPHKRNRHITPVQHRLRMLELAIADNPAFAISRVDVDRSGPSYTADTLRLLHEAWGPDTALYFVIGWDMLYDLPSWYHPAEVVRQVERLVVIRRPCYDESAPFLALLNKVVPGVQERLLPLETAQVTINSTDLRKRVADGRSIRYQVPDAVEQYILAQGLYLQPEAEERPEPLHPPVESEQPGREVP